MRQPKKHTLKELNFFPFSLSRIGFQIWLFIFTLAITLMLIGFQVSGRGGLWLGFLIAAFLLTIFYFYATPPIIAYLEGERVLGHHPQNLTELASKFARMIGAPIPSIYIFPSKNISAFGINQSVQGASIGLSSELLKKLSQDEIEVVIASQVAFIKSHTQFNFSLFAGLSHALIGFSAMLDSYWPTNWMAINSQPSRTRETLRLEFRPISSLIMPLAGAILRFNLNPQKYYSIDEITIQLTQKKLTLAEVLWKMHSYSQCQPLDIPPGTHHFFMTNPEGLRDSNWIFETHPKIDQRIRKISGYFPL